MTLLKIDNLSKHFDGIKALDDFSCKVNTGEILGLIGPNGAGKTTLFNVVTGFLKADVGRVQFKGKDILSKSPYRIYGYGITRTFQILRLIRQMTVLENVMLAFHNPGESLARLFTTGLKIGRQEAANREKAMALLEHTGLADKALDHALALSYGQQKLLSLVCCMASDPDLLLLDEPVAGINPTMIQKIQGLIKELPGKGKTVMLIEHNMDAVMALCDRIIFMDTGRHISEGPPEKVRRDPKVIDAYLE